MTEVANNKEDVSLKELIFKIQEFALELIRNWKLILLVTIPFILIFVYNAYTAPKVYSAQLTFMVDEDEGGGINSTMAILNQFGFSGGASGKYNLDRILELAKTRKITEAVFFEKIAIDNKLDFLANHIIKYHNLHEDWKDGGLAEFEFAHDSIPAFSKLEHLALKVLHSRVIFQNDVLPSFSNNLNEKTGIMTLSMKSQSDEITSRWLSILFNRLGAFYIEKSIEKQKATFDAVKLKTDSLKTALLNAEYELANFQDSNRNLWTKRSHVSEKQMNRKIQLLNIIYAESVKNLEISSFSLNNKTPVIQLIDQPSYPILPKKQSTLIALFMGLFLGIFISSSFVIARKIIRDSITD